MLALLVVLTLAGHARAKVPARSFQWKVLHRGVTYAAVATDGAAEIDQAVRDSRLHVLRIDPARARLVALVASELKKKPRTAKQWVDEHKLVAAINLGMYQKDHLTHVGYLRSGSHINSRRWVASYQSALAFDPRSAGIAPLLFTDLDTISGPKAFDNYRVVTQNLRLIKSSDGKRGQGVWTKQPKRWSEAAVAIDQKGRLLMLFTRVPLTMWELNGFLLSLPLGIVRAMHMEGGPEASLSIRAKGLNLDLCGSFETGFFPKDANAEQWLLPNVLGVQASD